MIWFRAALGRYTAEISRKALEHKRAFRRYDCRGSCLFHSTI